MIVHFYLLSLLLLILQRAVLAQRVQEMSPQDFKAAIDAGLFDAVVDVRSSDEFATEGHVEGATLVADLASSGTPESILGCQNCTLGVYCSAGVRARAAIGRLINEYGFPPENLFNGQGISQWTALGYPVVSTPSVEAPCSTDATYQCKAGDRPKVIQEMTAPEFAQAMDDGLFDVVIDIRRQDEWDAGHLINATFVTNLASNGVIDNLLGCEKCKIGLYCRTGNRVRSAIGRLTHEFGFQHDNLYNGLGVSQWTEAGYDLVTGESVPAECQANPEYQCKECCQEDATTTTSDGSSTTVEATDMAVDSMDQSSDNSTMEGDGTMESVDDMEDTDSTASAAPSLISVAVSLFSVSFAMVVSLLKN